MCSRRFFFFCTFTFILYTRENQQDTSVLVRGCTALQRSPRSVLKGPLVLTGPPKCHRRPRSGVCPRCAPAKPGGRKKGVRKARSVRYLCGPGNACRAAQRAAQRASQRAATKLSLALSLSCGLAWGRPGWRVGCLCLMSLLLYRNRRIDQFGTPWPLGPHI